ncbi:Predicted NAD/FAD-binding protein [Alteromonas sp. 38]|uniref:NAD(P)/FAD-dependent oxidoreductase n=1 Tax=Alteromonas TaxID=226 RepID=UPI0012EFE257|nr:MULTISPECIES: FAD-dependent oxidoreductase [Alteromonas]CAD5266532.1 Predicted NAD/FAD-binding protein [Alteromonas sp. 154]VXC05505.1 Predicted NAD/FAD-binding protein [Alteromonas sp. 38]
MTKNVAIIGTGISGLTCGYLLNKTANITVYESNDYIGGHTATKKINDEGIERNIDTGFIVFNDWTYPRFIKLMKQLDVAYQPTEMSFSVTSEKANIEYNGNTINSLFAQRRNILRPRFWRIVRDILKFNKACKAFVAEKRDTSSMTLQDVINELKLSDDFARYYILPMCAAIWSASLAQTRQFPLTFFLQFFNNHGLLNITDRPQWYTIKGGSSTYIPPLTASFKDKIKLSCGVTNVKKVGQKWQVTDTSGTQALFDDVIFACHSDQALAMLDTPSEVQQAVLGAIRFAENDVVMHKDTNQLPKRKLAWASWNYRLKDDAGEEERPASVTYDMNILQRLDAANTYCVTLNNTDKIDTSAVLGSYQYSHPQFSDVMVNAQQRRSQICGVDNLHFCGAYWYNGFHEDGVHSALDVCERFGAHL